jgi:predicted Zn-dependent protease with MMP-like domain
VDKARFEELVSRAIEGLPEEFIERMENIDVVVEDEPSIAQLEKSDIAKDETLLGLYEGIPLTERTGGYSFVIPDKISIFQKPIEAACENDAQIIDEVRRVVLHEIAHHFGIDDDRLEELGM